MKYILTIIALTVASTAWANPSNEAMKACLAKFNYTQDQFDTFDWSKALPACDYSVGVMEAEYAEMRSAQSHFKTWTKPKQNVGVSPREMPESAYIKQTAMGFEAGVSYKDTLPAGCYENGPWDNRDEN